MIYIATTNTDKFKNISNQIHSIFPLLETKPITNFKLEPPEENGASEEENCYIKAKYYHQKITQPIIAEDSAVYFENFPSTRQPGFLIHRKNQSIKDPISYWENFIKENKVKSGRINKHYCIGNKNIYFKCRIIVPIEFCTDGIRMEPPTTNIFNNFIIPKGFEKTIANFTNTEKLLFYKKYYLDSLKDVIIKSGINK